jgi:membrane-bound metal-dependent hydrolase YbcI (DUF457 family)
MAGFQTHMGVSTVLGVGYAAAGHLQLQLPLPACLLAGGLCSLSGMLPDLDSDSGVPIRETTSFAAAVTPLLMLDRYRQLGLSAESIVLASGLTYIIIRFGVGEILKRYTVHRGMWHSLPAVAIAGLLAFLVCCGQDMELRLYKTAAVLFGYSSHLLLDELYSLHWRRGRLRLKRSFGSALKLWGNSLWGNISTYGKLALLVTLTLNDLGMIEDGRLDIPRTARASSTRPESQQTSGTLRMTKDEQKTKYR